MAQSKNTKKEYISLYPLTHEDEYCLPGHSWGYGIRTHYVIHYVASGRGVLNCEGREFAIGKGQIFVIFPRTVIKYEADKKDPWHYSWINFYGNEAEEIFSRMGITPESPVFSVTNGVEILEVMSHMPLERSADIESNLEFSARLYELMSLLLKNTVASEKGENSYLTSAKRYIRSHYFEDITVEQISAHVGISRKYLFAIFKNALGVSPKEYIVDYRMRRAAEFLNDESISVGNIAYSVGYKDPLTFSKMFKMKMGVSPTEYRRRK